MRSDIVSLLVIAGPSGCGKSSFISELTSGRAPADITSHLPDVSGWPQTSVKRLSTGDDSPEAAPGLIVHYDTMRPYLMRIEDYTADQALMALLSASTLATILTIKIDRERLHRQYRARRSLFARFGFGKKLPLTAIYEDEDGTAKWATKWSMFCAGLGLQRQGITLLTIEPEVKDFAFKLVKPLARSVNPTVAAESADRGSEDTH
jgi:hypothetical protein